MEDLMSQNDIAPRRPGPPLATILTLVLAGTLASATGACAADWVERPFDPPTGTRWIIQSNETSDDTRDGHAQTSVMTETSELTIEQKIADGFRVTFVVRNATYEGDARTAALIGPMTRALENLVVHATTGLNGMPLRVENLDEVLTAVRTAIDNLTAPFSGKPQETATLRKMATAMLIADDSRAPKIYLATLVTLALGQNTGLRPGETRRDADEAVNPFSGAPIKSNTMLRIDRADPATGNVHLIRTRAFDSDAIKEFLSRLAQQFGGGDGKDTNLDNFMKQFSMTLDSRTEIDVEDGMTRAVRQEDTATASTPGHSIVKHGHKVITVTQAP
jgi:hypothetical protein